MKILIILTSYSRILMFIMSIVCCYNGIKKIKIIDDKIIGIFCLSIISIVDSITYIYIVLIKQDKTLFTNLSAYTQLLYQFLEIIIIFHFYLKTEIKEFKFFNISKLILIASSIFLLIIFSNYNEKDILITIIELVIINIFSIRFFFSNFKSKHYQESSFKYISFGLFIFANFTAPYYIIENKLEINQPSIIRSLNFINDLGYTILFAFINKEIKCIVKK